MEKNEQKVRENIRGQIQDEYGKLAYTYTCHNKDAQILSNRMKILKISKLVLSGISTAGFIRAVFPNGTIIAIISAIISAALFVITTLINEEQMAGNITSHKKISNQLWLLREHYISLLSEFDCLEIQVIQSRRDQLLIQTNEIYKIAPQTSSAAYKKAQKALKEDEEQFFEDWEIDRMLPKQLRKDNWYVKWL